MNPIVNSSIRNHYQASSICLPDWHRFEEALREAKLHENSFAIHALKNIDDKKYSLKLVYSVLCLLSWLWQDDDKNPGQVPLKQPLRYNFLLDSITEIHESKDMLKDELQELFHKYYDSAGGIDLLITEKSENRLSGFEIDRNSINNGVLKIYLSHWLSSSVSLPLQHLVGVSLLRFRNEYIDAERIKPIILGILGGFPNNQCKEKYLEGLIARIKKENANCSDLLLLLEKLQCEFQQHENLSPSNQMQHVKNQETEYPIKDLNSSKSISPIFIKECSPEKADLLERITDQVGIILEKNKPISMQGRGYNKTLFLDVVRTDPEKAEEILLEIIGILPQKHIIFCFACLIYEYHKKDENYLLEHASDLSDKLAGINLDDNRRDEIQRVISYLRGEYPRFLDDILDDIKPGDQDLHKDFRLLKQVDVIFQPDYSFKKNSKFYKTILADVVRKDPKRGEELFSKYSEISENSENSEKSKRVFAKSDYAFYYARVINESYEHDEEEFKNRALEFYTQFRGFLEGKTSVGVDAQLAILRLNKILPSDKQELAWYTV